jgi:ABC-type glutathione transport system ATPase component
VTPPDGLAVQVEGLRKSFPRRGGGGEVLAVDDVSFEVPRGGALAIVGESGSGKTTIARMLLGLERPTGGRILLGGLDRSEPPRSASARLERAREIQIVFQDPYRSLDPRQSAVACIDEVLRVQGMKSESDRRSRIAELMGVVGLDDRQARALPRRLSGGQRQRVAIARALAVAPDVLVLDEAVAALDVSIQAQTLNLLADVREQTGVSYLLISHDLAVVRQVSEETIVMRQGQVVERGSTNDVLDRPQHPYTRLLRDSVPRPGWKPVRRSSATTDTLQVLQ